MAEETVLVPLFVELIKDPIRQYIVNPITRRIGYVFKGDSKVKALQSAVVDLKNKKLRLQQSVDEAKRNGDEIYENVTEWLETVEKDIAEAEELIQRKKEAKKKWFAGFFTSFKIRYQLSKKADEKASAIGMLLNNALGFDPISFRPPLQPIVEPSMYDREALPSRVLLLNQIVDALKDPNLYMIGVYGMGGVGKTTLAKEVKRKAIDEKLFETVVMVPVSQTPELRKIQGDIADFLGSKLDAEEVSGRASQLHHRLKTAKVLIILDDVWQKLDLNAVGIPIGDEYKGCKILLTSRRRDVLSNEIGTQKEFSLDALKEDESWRLFEMSATKAKDPELHAIATEVAKKCAGLPLLILKVATDLRNKESYVWNDMLRRLSSLENTEIYEKVHKVIESSYEKLLDEEAKSLFLLCALFGNSNIQIHRLLTYCMGLGLFKHMDSIEGARNRVLSLIDKLKNQSLLLDGDKVGFVKIHDVVRDIALVIASRVQHAFVGTTKVSSTDLQKKDYTRISLPYCVITEIPGVLECPEAKVFSLFQEYGKLDIPDSFFEGVTKLKVVDFIGVRFMSGLPSSLGFLTGLRSLSLEQCQFNNVAVIAELKQLEFLSFARSYIKELPGEFKALTRLKLLDLTGCSNLRVIPAYVLSNLSLLEELYMLDSFYGWEVDGNARFMELQNLAHLTKLEMHLKDDKLLPEDWFFKGLRNYRIYIGSYWKDKYGEYETSRVLMLHNLRTSVGLMHRIKEFVRGTEVLQLYRVHGIKNLLFDCSMENINSLEKIDYGQLGVDSFWKLQILKVRACESLKVLFPFSFVKCLRQLEQIEVEFCDNMEAIVDEGSADEMIEFAQLTSLKLSYLDDFAGLCKTIGMVSFPNLTSLEVYRCKSLKYVFTTSTVKFLKQLKKLEIKSCESMEEIILGKKQYVGNSLSIFKEEPGLRECVNMEAIVEDEVIEFSQLTSLTLRDLRHFTGFCKTSEKVAFPNLSGMVVEECNSLKYVFTTSMVKSLQQFKKLEIGNCKSMEEIVLGKKLEEIEEENGVDSFWKLQILNISRCSSLKILFPFSCAKCLAPLQHIVVQYCNLEALVGEGSADEVIEFAELTSLVLKGLYYFTGFCKTSGMVAFPNLTSMVVTRCISLKYVFTTSMVKSLEQLKKLEISECKSMEEIILGKKFEEIKEENISKIEFLKLESISLQELPNLKRVACGFSIEFVSLKRLEMKELHAMENFVSKFSSRSDNESMDEHFFNELVSLSNLEILVISSMGNLRYLWHPQFADDLSFSKLKSLKIEYCSKLPVVFPSNGYRRFWRLESLDLSSCEGVEEIYSFEEVDIVQPFALQKVSIRSLSSLKHIWSKGDAFRATTFENLQSVKVSWCNNLKYVFLASIACGLLQLQELDICLSGVKLIVANTKHEGSEGTTTQTFEWPKLKILDVTYCPHLIKFGANTSKFIPNVEDLSLDHHSLKAIRSDGFPDGLSLKLAKVQLYRLEEESIPFLLGLLKRIYSLEKLRFRDGDSFAEAFSLDDGRSLGEEQQYHPRLKHLELDFVSNLKHIVKKDCQLNPIFQYVQALDVSCCDGLMNIAPSSTSFQNVGTLNVSSCHSMTSLVTASTAKTMVHLMELRVHYCTMMEVIVARDDGGYMEQDVIIFKNLKHLELTNLDRLHSFCYSNYSFNFPLLEEVKCSRCPRMKFFCGGVLSTPNLRGVRRGRNLLLEGDLNATIASQLTKWVGGQLQEAKLFPNLDSLEMVNDAFSSKAIVANQLKSFNGLGEMIVRDCDLVEVVFDLEGLSAEDGDVQLLPQLYRLHLINLPMLSQICNKAPRGILNFKRLRYIKIENCSRFKYVFTWPMASCLFQLREIEVKNCEMMETIIKEEEVEDATQVTFGSLESFVVECLPKFSSFYSGRGDLECPSLKKISIRACPNIKAFISRLIMEDTQGMEVHNFHFSHKLFPKFEEVSLDIKSIIAILQIELPTNFFSEVKNLGLGYFFGATTKSHNTLLHFLPMTPNLHKLEVCHSSIKDLFNFGIISYNVKEVMSTVPQVRDLKLENLDDLKQIWWQNSEFNATLFQSLKNLEVRSCGNLINLASSSASFQNLITLEVYGCNQLRNLITSPVAKSMVQLKKLKVESCKMLTEIVGDGNDGTTNEIVFTKMESIELIGLQRLESFSSGHYTLDFPCLRYVDVPQCPNLRIFCPGIILAPTLKVVRGWGYDWQDDLNTTIQYLYKNKVKFDYLEDAKLSILPVLKEKWGDEFPFNYFKKLKRLVVDDSAQFSKAISSHLVQRLKWLNVLIVERCELVEQVFDLEGLNACNSDINQMKNLNELQLIDLPRLSSVWSKDPEQILSFRNLHLLKVHNCGNLTYVFNLLMASSLPNLQHVEVKYCSLVEHIITKAEEETMQEYQTVFPSLQTMNLQCLANLSSFYSTSGFLECPSLKFVEVVQCPNMDLFASSFMKEQDSCIVEEMGERIIIKDPDSMAAFLGNMIAIPKMEELKVEWNKLKDNLKDKFLSRLKLIHFTGFEGEYATLPSNLLQNFPKLEKLALCDASMEEINLDELSIFHDERPESVGLLTKLMLSKLPKLKHLVRDRDDSHPMFQNLEDLEVCECNRLKILVPSLASFQNLTNLQVSKCDGMKNLITASTARSLVQLRRLNVKDCKMMHEIIGTETDGMEYEIRFSQLEHLEIDDLPSLTGFCSRRYAFFFPSLVEVVVIECPNMKNFSEKAPIAPKLKKVKVGRHEYDWEWEGDLNNTIQALFEEKED